jgi:hypothetical protein
LAWLGAKIFRSSALGMSFGACAPHANATSGRLCQLVARNYAAYPEPTPRKRDPALNAGRPVVWRILPGKRC